MFGVAGRVIAGSAGTRNSSGPPLVSSGLLFKDPTITEGLVLDNNKIYTNGVELNPPTNVTAPTAGPTSITLNFVAPFIRGSITEYRVYETEQALGLVGTYSYTDQANVTIGSLTALTPYTFYVVASDGTNESTASNSIGKSTVGTEFWNLDPTNFVSTEITGMLPVIIHPRPDIETPVNAYSRNAYTGMLWEIPVSVQGGSWPFKYELMNPTYTATGIAGTDYPIDMSIGSVLDPVTDHQEVGLNYGTIVWTNPVGPSETIYIQVTDQDGNKAQVSITIAIGISEFVFVDATAPSEGIGTLADPLKTFVTGLWGGSDADSTYAGKIAVFKNGSYVIHDGTNGASSISIDKPIAYVPYHNGASFDTVAFDMSQGGNIGFFANVSNIHFAGIGFDGNGAAASNWRCISISPSVDSFSAFKNTFDNMNAGISNIDNPACIMLPSASGKSKYISIVRNTQGVNCDLTLCTLFVAEYILFEHNIGDGTSQGSHNGDMFLQPKADCSNLTIRANRAINTTPAGRGGIAVQNQENYAPAPQCKFQEVCWNTMEAAGANQTNRINAQGNSQSIETFWFRNTLINSIGKPLYFGANGVGNDTIIIGNAIYGADGSILGTTYDDTLDALVNQELTASDFDANAKLTGAARIAKLGTYGAEVA